MYVSIPVDEGREEGHRGYGRYTNVDRTKRERETMLQSDFLFRCSKFYQKSPFPGHYFLVFPFLLLNIKKVHWCMRCCIHRGGVNQYMYVCTHAYAVFSCQRLKKDAPQRKQPIMGR